MFHKRRSFQLSPRLRVGVGRTVPKFNFLKFVTVSFMVLSAILGFNAYRLYMNLNTTEAYYDANVARALGTTANNESSKDELTITPYTVVKGDTIFNIAKKFNIPWTLLATVNAIESPFNVTPGQEIKIPYQ